MIPSYFSSYGFQNWINLKSNAVNCVFSPLCVPSWVWTHSVSSIFDSIILELVKEIHSFCKVRAGLPCLILMCRCLGVLHVCSTLGMSSLLLDMDCVVRVFTSNISFNVSYHQWFNFDSHFIIKLLSWWFPDISKTKFVAGGDIFKKTNCIW